MIALRGIDARAPVLAIILLGFKLCEPRINETGRRFNFVLQLLNVARMVKVTNSGAAIRNGVNAMKEKRNGKRQALWISRQPCVVTLLSMSPSIEE